MKVAKIARLLIVIAPAVMLISQTANAAIVATGSGISPNYNSGWIEALCKTTQTQGAQDYAAFPYGKAAACGISPGGGPLGGPDCSTDHSSTHSCSSLTPYAAYIEEETYYFAAIAFPILLEGDHQVTMTLICGSSGCWGA